LSIDCVGCSHEPGDRFGPVGPKAYDAWRATSLGRVTEAIEQRLVFEVMGALRNAHILDAGSSG
jgi:hypothetical protein